MTSDVGTTDYTDSDLRDRFPEVVVSSSGKSTKVLHIPDGDEAEPLCGVIAVSKGWIRKSVDVYPGPDYYEYCDRCRGKLRESERYGNALESDWG